MKRLLDLLYLITIYLGTNMISTQNMISKYKKGYIMLEKLWLRNSLIG